MKQMNLSLEDDGTFNGRIVIDGVVAASVNGNVPLCTVTGAAAEFAEVLRTIGLQRWTYTESERTAHAQGWWKPLHAVIGEGWGFLLPNGCYLDGLESEAAAHAAMVRLRDMWDALITQPDALYEVFQTDGEGWGYFDRAGVLHATFPTSQAAQEMAGKRKETAP